MFSLIALLNQNKVDPKWTKKRSSILYCYRKCGTHAQVFSQTLAHGNSKNERRPIKQRKKTTAGKSEITLRPKQYTYIQPLPPEGNFITKRVHLYPISASWRELHHYEKSTLISSLCLLKGTSSLRKEYTYIQPLPPEGNFIIQRNQISYVSKPHGKWNGHQGFLNAYLRRWMIALL